MMPHETRQKGDGKTGPQMLPHDASRVNPDDDHDLIYWSSRFDCTREQLRSAIEKVGNSVTAVEKELLAEK
jgi:hypothetical protein